jgi:hypothetical protein
MRKKKRLEDIVPGNELKNILCKYRDIQQIENPDGKYKSGISAEIEKALKHRSTIEKSLYNLVDEGWLEEKEAGEFFLQIDAKLSLDNKRKIDLTKFHLLNKWLKSFHFKNKQVERRQAGNIKDFAEDFLIFFLCRLLIKYSKKPQYSLIVDFLIKEKIKPKAEQDAYIKRVQRIKKNSDSLATFLYRLKMCSIILWNDSSEFLFEKQLKSGQN